MNEFGNQAGAHIGRLEQQAVPVRGLGYPSTAPVPTGSLSDALNRLNQAVSATGELGSNIGQRLEAVGMLRPSVPQPDVAHGNGKAGMESQLAQGVMVLAQMLESHNGRLSDLLNRIDS